MEQLTRDSSSKYININSPCSSVTKNNPIRKWLAGPDRYFSKEDVHWPPKKAKKYMERCSVLLTLEKCKSKPQ